MSESQCTEQLPLFEMGRQQVYQILAGYPDGNDAQLLQDDPLFNTIVGKNPLTSSLSTASGRAFCTHSVTARILV